MTSEVPFSMDVVPAGSNNGGNGMWGDGGWWVLIILFALFGGWGNGGYGYGNGGGAIQGALTRGDLCMDMNFNGLENAVRGVNQGLCDGFYAMNTSLLNGFHGVDNAICTMGYQNAQLINGVQMGMMQGFNGVTAGQNALATQLAQCCCDLRSGLAENRFQAAQDTCAIQNTIQNTTRDVIDSQNANTRAILEKLTAQEIAAKDAQIAAQNQQIFGLQLKASQEAQNAYLVNQLRPCPTPAYLTCNPWASQAGYGSCGTCNSGCGCGL